MSVETLVMLGVVYAIGFYVAAFIVGMTRCGVFNEDDWWLAGIFWPICVLIIIVVELQWLCESLFAKLKSRFPGMTKFVQRVWKRIRTAIFAVSLVFRPAKLGEIVGKRIFRDRV